MLPAERERENRWPRKAARLALPCLILLAGLLLTAASAWTSWQNNQTTLRDAVRVQADLIQAEIGERLRHYQYGLNGIRGLIATIGPDHLTRQQFLRYSLSRDISAEFPGARGFGFIRRVPAAQERAFVERARHNGQAGYAVRQIHPQPRDRYLIQYFEPQNGNEQAIGLDIASEPLRREAADISMRAAQTILSQPITLVTSPHAKSESFLLLQPIFSDGSAPLDAQSREQRLIGWSYAALSMPEVLAGTRPPANHLSLRIADGSAPGPAREFFAPRAAASAEKAIYRYTSQLEIYGRVWQVSLDAAPEFAEDLRQTSPAQIALAGALASLGSAASCAIWLQSRRRDRKLRQAEAELAAIVADSIDAIIGKTLDGVVTSWNHGAEQLFGYPASEALGRRLADLIIPPDLQNEETTILSAIGRGEAVMHFQTRRRGRDGSELEVSIAVSPIHDKNGMVAGASTTIRDITRQKTIENEIRALNANLEQQVALRTGELDSARRTLKTVMDAVPSMIGYWDRNQINRVANRAYHQWLGVEADTMPGRALGDMLGAERYQEDKPRIEAALAGEPQTFEHSETAPNGQRRYLLTHYIPDAMSGSVHGFYTLIHDITEQSESRIELAAALHENKVLLATINEQLLYSTTDLEGRILDFNDNFCRAHGYSREELMGRNHRSLSSGVHPRAFWKNMWETLQGGHAWRGEICNLGKDGAARWFDTVIAPFVGRSGQPERYIALRVDITERKAGVVEIDRLNRMLGNVLRAASEVAIIATAPDGLITMFNSGAQRMLGYQETEVIGKTTPVSFLSPGEVARRSAELAKGPGLSPSGFTVLSMLPEMDGAEIRDWSYVRKDGSQLTVAQAMTAMLDEAGEISGYLCIATDITPLRRQQQELASARDQLLLAAEVANLGVWSWSLLDNSLLWNPKMYTLYALSDAAAEAALSYPKWRERVHPDDIHDIETAFGAALASGDELEHEAKFRIIHPDGAIRHIQAAARIERAADGSALRMTGINVDVTDRLEFETAMLEAKRLAEEASMAKGRFLANMSHEIRTPMNAVLGMLQLLRNTSLETRQADYAAKAHLAAQSLLGLLNDILDYSKIEAGKLQLDPHPFELEEWMRSLAVVLSGTLGEKDVELLFEIAPTLPRRLLGDSLRLQQILINLAGNAIKFTPQGYVIIRLEERGRTEEDITIRFSVSDTGIGISREQAERIFDGFAQAEASTTRRFGGTGLGLAISKKLTEMMGGALQLESEPGRGSCFWFDLRLKSESDARISPKGGDNDVDLRILVVDDNSIAGEAMRHTIESMGWHADYAPNGLAAIDEISRAIKQGQPYDIALMDWRMPDLDGLSTAQAIQESCIPAPIVIMITAFGREKLTEASQADNPPFVDFLTKPVTPQQIFDTIQSARQVRISPEHVPPAPPQPSGRLEGLKILVVEDNALNRQVACELFQSEGAAVALADGGLSGVRQATADEADFDLIVMDVQMPDIDGMEATRRIRAQARHADVPILAITANASPADRAQCLESGMNEHVGKPIDINEVVPIIQSLTGIAPPIARPAPKPAPAQEAGGQIEPIDRILARFNHKPEFYRKTLAHFEPECRQLLDELRSRMPSGTVQELAATLHTIKGVAATTGALGLSAQAASLEKEARTASALPAGWPGDATMARLDALLVDSVVRLQNAIESTGAATTGMPMAKQNLASLRKLLQHLQNNDLEALRHIDALQLDADRSLLQELLILSGKVHALRFSEAMEQLSRLIAKLES
ncbi:PAS domain S-box protein [Chromobacterium sp. IIBBL 290-4]|uniref:PAS domain S-box protein n=1 Tax=Chromobacterium sp. IIBBL 290-4 TaxID=2953890 RepID=UPI0020B680BA|nr:PAS domain S-box protein [Chromobacterium sp. IIBBL 290-4]UTH73881.1 PAS domain S-box protein [Chromobacterium sp. IIBBL 290-4]